MRTCNPFDPTAVRLAREISAKLKASEKFEPLKPEGMFFDGRNMVGHWSNGVWNVTHRRFESGWPVPPEKSVQADPAETESDA